MIKSKILQLSLLGIIAGVLFITMAPKVSNIYSRQAIERENEETILEVQSTKVVKESLGILRNDQELLLGLTREQETKELPENAYLEVPFYCQAPLETVENWTFHEESCEEAAVLQAFGYLIGEQYSKQEAHEIILDMISWQEEFFGSHKDLYADEMKTFISKYLEIDEGKIIIIRNAEIEDIKREINRGYPVIVPITGEILKNPYYPYPGYHMLTVIGYSSEKIITNDNGTMHGENFSYDIHIFEKAYKDADGDIIVIKIDKNSQFRTL